MGVACPLIMILLLIVDNGKDMGCGEFLLKLADKTPLSRSTLVVAGRFLPITKSCSWCW
jgi:hypothetical protein